MVLALTRLLFLALLFFNAYYIFTVDQKINTISNVLNIAVEDQSFFSFLTQVAQDVEKGLDEQRNKVRDSIRKKGIEERNKVLMKTETETYH